MKYLRNNYWIFLLIIAYACKKAPLVSDKKDSNKFGAEGRDFSFACQVCTGSAKVFVRIPAGAVNHTSYLEYYQFKVNNVNDIDSFYVNQPTGDVNVLIADDENLLTPAIIALPFYFAPAFSIDSGYFPYRITANSYDNIDEVMNSTGTWEKITSFIAIDSTKHLVFNTSNLRGIYVVAKKK